MKKHPTDLVALFFGLVFAVTGAAFVVYEATDRRVDPARLSAIALILLGVIALTITLARAARQPREVETP